MKRRMTESAICLALVSGAARMDSTVPATSQVLVEIVTSIHARFGERPGVGPIIVPPSLTEAPRTPAKRKPLRAPHPDQGALFGGSVAVH